MDDTPFVIDHSMLDEPAEYSSIPGLRAIAKSSLSLIDDPNEQEIASILLDIEIINEDLRDAYRRAYDILGRAAKPYKRGDNKTLDDLGDTIEYHKKLRDDQTKELLKALGDEGKGSLGDEGKGSLGNEGIGGKGSLGDEGKGSLGAEGKGSLGDEGKGSFGDEGASGKGYTA